MTPKQAHCEITNYLKFLENIKTASPHTLRAYKIDLNQLWRHEKISGSSLKLFLIESIRTWQKLAPASRNRKIGCLKGFLNWLYDQEKIPDPLADLFYSPKVPKRIPHFLSFDEILSCLKVLSPAQNLNDRQAFESIQTRLLFLILYGCGLRISEAVTLTYSQVIASEKKIYITGKGNKERVVVAPELFWSEWTQFQNEMKSYSKSRWIFSAWKNPELTVNTRTAYQWIVNVGARAGLTHRLNPHALRHSFATHLLNSGANLRVIQSLLGHSTLMATEKYTHLNLSELYRTMESKHPLGKGSK